MYVYNTASKLHNELLIHILMNTMIYQMEKETK